MELQKIFFADNLRFLRNRKKISQEDLAHLLGISRAKLASLESGKTVNPPLEDQIKFSDYYKIAIDTLVRVDISRLSGLQLRELQAGNDVYLKGSKVRVLSITVTPDNKENVEHVPVKAKAGYASNCSDPEYIATLPRFTMPNLPKNATFRIFPITGDSMLPIPDKSDIIAKYIADWKSIKAGTPCIVIMKGQDFVFKLVTLNKRLLQLRSLNPEYHSYEVPVEDVLEIWEFYSYQTKTFPDEPTDMAGLYKLIKNMQQDITYLKSRNKSAEDEKEERWNN